jgi:shikimate kinase
VTAPTEAGPGPTAAGRGPSCVLVGPPGAGKTTIGALVAHTLGVAFRDTDADIVAAAGKPVSDIFFDDGEDAFRAMEQAAVAAALSTFDGVLALGGGAVLAEPTRALLRAHTVVFLSVELSDAVNRVGLNASRPLLAVNPRSTLKFLLDQRRPLYQEVATATVTTDGRSPDEVAADVLAVLEKVRR